jgi:hypothetical protein
MEKEPAATDGLSNDRGEHVTRLVLRDADL